MPISNASAWRSNGLLLCSDSVGTCMLRRLKVNPMDDNQQENGTISEKISELVRLSERPRRGRPKAFSENWEKLMAGQRVAGMKVVGPSQTRRGQLNALYFLHALGVLSLCGVEHEQLRWLFDIDENRFKRTILAELGRIQDNETMAKMAVDLCELKPITCDAVGMIRRFRLGGLPQASATGLLHHIIEYGIGPYEVTHTGVTPQLVREALRELLGRIHSTLEDEADEQNSV